MTVTARYVPPRGTIVQTPIRGGVAVTPSDTDDLARVSDYLYIGTAGTLKIIFADGVTLVFAAIAAGLYPFRVSRVYSNGTSATNIVALWE